MNVCENCGCNLGCETPCHVCGGAGVIDEEDYLDAGYAKPGKLMICAECEGEGDVYHPTICPQGCDGDL